MTMTMTMTYPSNLYTRAQMRRPMNLSPMQPAQNAAKVRRKRRQHLRAVPSHAHQADGRLRMGAHLGAVDDAHGVDLRVPSCRAAFVSNWTSDQRARDLRIVSVSAAFAVIDAGGC